MLLPSFSPQLIETVTEIAGDVLSLYHSSVAIKFKKDNSPVTEADQLSHSRLISFLQQTNYPIISEESEDKEIPESDFVWLIDPIDGTQDFINRTGEFSIMIGLLKNKDPFFGLVVQPTTGKIYIAQKNKGAYVLIKKKRIRLHATQKTSLTDVRLTVSRNHITQNDEELIALLRPKSVVRMGSIGLKVGLIAEGKSDILLTTSNKTCEWDTCAPQIILEESGGIMTDLLGNKLEYLKKNPSHKNGLLASHSAIHQQIVSYLQKK